MFTEEEQKDILRVKETIEIFIDSMKREKWAEGYILPWDKVFLSGGSIASLINVETPKDFDFYFEDIPAMNEMSEHLKKHKEEIADLVSRYGDAVVGGKMITAQAITMKNKWSFITMLAGTPDQVRKSFDYVHCKPYYSLREKKFYISEEQYRACKQKKLIVNNPIMVKRYREEKFLERGFKK